MPRGKVSVCKSWWARSRELWCSQATPMYWFCRRLFPQTSAIRQDSISELKPESYSAHLIWEASGDRSRTSCRLFFRSRRRSFETISRFFQAEIARYRGLLKQRVSSFSVAG
jgi:hypothetical protein